MKRRFKVLPLPTWCSSNVFNKRSRCLDRFEQILPVFNRPGWYYDRSTGKSWVEFEGEAWESPSSGDFLFDLECNDGDNRMDPRVYGAISVLIEARMASPKQARAHHIEGIRKLLHSQRVYGLKALKRFRDFKKARGL